MILVKMVKLLMLDERCHVRMLFQSGRHKIRKSQQALIVAYIMKFLPLLDEKLQLEDGWKSEQKQLFLPQQSQKHEIKWYKIIDIWSVQNCRSDSPYGLTSHFRKKPVGFTVNELFLNRGAERKDWYHLLDCYVY